MDNYEKKYKEALERARSIFNEEAVPTPLTKGACEYIFPELKESEDEKIRKQIRAFIKSRGSQITQSKTDAWLAWLEKQGEQKPVIIPKFRVGDLIKDKICDKTYKVTEFIDNGIAYTDENGERFTKYYDEDDWDSYELVEQKPAWSEEDECCRNQLIIFCENWMVQDSNAKKCANWLKSLRPQKPEWSEEDKNLREATIGLLNLVQPHDAKSWGKSRYDCIDWLRNLRPKNNAYHEGFKNGFAKARGMGYKQWKPSDEQIMYIGEAIDLAEKSEKFSVVSVLKDIREQLKKLREKSL